MRDFIVTNARHSNEAVTHSSQTGRDFRPVEKLDAVAHAGEFACFRRASWRRLISPVDRRFHPPAQLLTLKRSAKSRRSLGVCGLMVAALVILAAPSSAKPKHQSRTMRDFNARETQFRMLSE
jgi:hypothetical protein